MNLIILAFRCKGFSFKEIPENVYNKIRKWIMKNEMPTKVKNFYYYREIVQTVMPGTNVDCCVNFHKNKQFMTNIPRFKNIYNRSVLLFLRHLKANYLPLFLRKKIVYYFYDNAAEKAVRISTTDFSRVLIANTDLFVLDKIKYPSLFLQNLISFSKNALVISRFSHFLVPSKRWVDLLFASDFSFQLKKELTDLDHLVLFNGACSAGRLDFCEKFSENISNTALINGLSEACCENKLQIVKFILPKVKTIVNKSVISAMWRSGNIEIVKFFEEHVCVSFQDIVGDVIFESTSVELIKYVFEKNRDLVNDAFILACRVKNYPIIDYILKHEKVNALTKETRFQDACEFAEKSLVRLLLPHIRKPLVDLCFVVACNRNNFSIIKILATYATVCIEFGFQVTNNEIIKQYLTRFIKKN